MSALRSQRSGAAPKAATGFVRTSTPPLAEIFSPLNLHWAGVAVLSLLCAYFLVQIAILWQRANADNASALAEQSITLRTAQLAARPLEGLDVKLARSTAEADQFYRERLPVSYSEVAEQLGAIAHRDNVRLTRVQYAPKAVLGETGQQLSEVQMDAALSGDYRSLVDFINGVERDKQFFLIDNIALTGQQTGQVNLRIRMTTYLRGVPPLELDDQVSADAAQTQAAPGYAAPSPGQPASGGGAR